MIFVCYGICFGRDPLPSLEGRTLKVEKENFILAEIERQIPTQLYRRLELETGKEPYINVGVDTKIIPYSAKLKYLLDPEDQYSPYYLFSTGVNLVEGEEVYLDEILDDFRQMINYGVGVGVSFKNIEIEILYGIYNYQTFGIIQQEKKSLYSATKITLGCKYRF